MERKTKLIIDALKHGPMKAVKATKIAGGQQLQSLVKTGCVIKYTDENPDYSAGTRGQKPMCLWIKIGSLEYVEPKMGTGQKIAGKKGIAAAIKVLERAGYTVLPPNKQ